MTREIRDPVHGFIQLEESEVKIIDQPIFQRLRRIKQLALANLLYPGALHTRFDHSLGARHVAGKMARALALTGEDDLRCLRLTALLHDLGHGPFSHVSENLLQQFADPKLLQTQGMEEIHELITIQLIEKKISSLMDFDKERIIGIMLSAEEDKRGPIVKLLKLKDCPPSPIFKQIISGPLDADKQDYLLRDSYFCGVKYGIFDIDRLHNTLTAIDDPASGGAHLAIKEDGVHSVEQYVMAKYYMNTQVYRHRLRLATDAMIVRGLELGIRNDKLSFLKDLYAYDGSDEFLDNYVQWDDERLTTEILSQGKGEAKQMFARLAERKLFKQIYMEKLDRIQPAAVRDAIPKLKDDLELKRRLEKRIGERLCFNPDHVIVVLYKIKSVRAQVQGTEGEIEVKSRGSFQGESILFNSINSAMEEQCLEIYAPAEYSTEIDKNRKLNDWREKVEQVFAEELGREES